MRTFLVFSLTCLSGLLISCGRTSLSLHELNYLRKGMSVDTVDKILPIKPTSQLTLDNSPSYVVHSYPLLVEVIVSGGSAGGMNGMGGYSAPTPSTTTTFSNSVFLIYSADGLRYWGMMGDIQKSEDVEIQQLAPRLVGLR